VPGNDDTITVYGLDEGLEMNVHKGNQGLQLGDAVDQEAEFSGDVEKAPVLLEPTSATTYATRIGYLEALRTSGA
jgi:hypothetical protein